METAQDERVDRLEQQVELLKHKLQNERSKNEMLQRKLAQRDSALARASATSSQMEDGHTHERVSSGQGQLEDRFQDLGIDPSRLAAEKADLENALEAEQEYIMHKLNKQLAAVKHDKNVLKQEQQQLKSKLKELNGSVSRLSREKIDLERSLELEEEAFINSLFRQVANVMDNYKAMDEAMQKHGIRITAVPPRSPRHGVMLARQSTTSQPAASVEGSTPSTSARGSPSVRASASASASTSARAFASGAGGAFAHRPMSARQPSGGTSSPGASLHATREQLEALTRGFGAHGGQRGTVRSEDSMSSMGSIMSAFSRDPSITRDTGTGNIPGAPQPPQSGAAGAGAAAAPGQAMLPPQGPHAALGVNYPSSTASDSGRSYKGQQ